MARLEVEIIGDSRSLEKAFARSEKSARGFNQDMSKAGQRGTGVFSKLTKGIGIAAGGLGVAGLAGAAHAAFTEMADSQKVAAQTGAVLESTGHAANVSAKQVDTLATSLMNKSGADDETVKSGENMLLTFTSIRNEAGKGNDIFNQATKATLDLSTAMGRDMADSAVLVGKALNAPLDGLTALRRVGVQFTAQQIEMIKGLVGTGAAIKDLDTVGVRLSTDQKQQINVMGDLADTNAAVRDLNLQLTDAQKKQLKSMQDGSGVMMAQKIILGELTKEFGGSAVAAGKTLPGQLNILKQTLLNLGGTIMQQLSPAIIALTQRLLKWLQNSKNQKTILNAVNAVAKAVATTFRVLSAVFNTLAKVTGGTANAVKVLIAAFVALKALQMAGAIAGIARQMGILGTTTGGATVATRGLSGALGKAGLAGAALLAGYGIGQLILKLPGMESVMRSAGSAAYDFATKIGLIHDPMEQFKGKTVLSQRAASFIREQARRLEAGGMTPMEAAQRIAAQHPNVARHDIDVLAGGYARRPSVQIHGDVHVHGVRNVRELQDQITKAHRGRPVRRRGDP